MKTPHFGALLAHAAAEQGVTQAVLAKRLGITQHRVSEIFNAENITERLFKRCVKALRMKLEIELVKR